MNSTAMRTDDIDPGLLADKAEYATTEEAAETLGLTDARVKQLLATGKLVGHKPEGRRAWRIERASIRRYDEYRKAIEAAKRILKS